MTPNADSGRVIETLRQEIREWQASADPYDEWGSGYIQAIRNVLTRLERTVPNRQFGDAMNRYSVYKDGPTTKLIESQDGGRTWSPYHLSADTAHPIADALNAWHSEGAVESLSAALDALVEEQ